jgi:hypothetical protein
VEEGYRVSFPSSCKKKNRHARTFFDSDSNRVDDALAPDISLLE